MQLQTCPAVSYLKTCNAGPNTLVGLSKQPEGSSIDAATAVAAFVPAYTQLLSELKSLGVPEVQIHEPILTTHRADALQANFKSSFTELSKVGLPIDLVTYYDDVGAAYPWVITLPVQVIASYSWAAHCGILHYPCL